MRRWLCSGKIYVLRAPRLWNAFEESGTKIFQYITGGSIGSVMHDALLNDAP